MVENQQDNRTDNRDQNAIEVDSRDAWHPKGLEEETTDHGTDHAEYDIEKNAFTGLVDQLTGDKSCNQSKDNPRDK